MGAKGTDRPIIEALRAALANFVQQRDEAPGSAADERNRDQHEVISSPKPLHEPMPRVTHAPMTLNEGAAGRYISFEGDAMTRRKFLGAAGGAVASSMVGTDRAKADVSVPAKPQAGKLAAPPSGVDYFT